MSEPVILTPLSDCPVPMASCCPQGYDAVSLYNALKAMCSTVEYLLGTVDALKAALPAQDKTSTLQRTVTTLTSEVNRLKKNAIVCISWNEDTCEIQGGVLDGPVKVFAKDPCGTALADRVRVLENDQLDTGSLTELNNTISALTTTANSAVKVLSVDGADLRIETVGGAVTTLDVRAAPTATIMQQTWTTGASVASYAIPFVTDVESVVEIDLSFLNPAAGKTYNLDVQTALGASINTYTGLTTGTTVDNDGTDVFHKTRKALIALAAGSWKLVITTADASNMVSLQISTQIKSLP